MFKNKTQKLAHDGNRDALREIYNEYSREVYAMIHSALIDEDSTHAAMKQVFLNLFREIMHSDGDVRIAARLTELTNDEIRISRIAGGDLSKEALRSDFKVSGSEADPEPAEGQEDDGEDEDDFLDEPAPSRSDKKVRTVSAPKKKPKKSNSLLNVLSVILLIVLIVIFLWLVAGILMDYQLIPYCNFGYRWFNGHVFELFRLTAVQ